MLEDTIGKECMGASRGSLNQLLTAIVENDLAKVKGLLSAEPGLASSQVAESKFYDSEIFHWLYPGDTPLHLAAAGYRHELMRLLLASGADPNARGNHRRSSPLHYAADGYITGPAWNATSQVKAIHLLLDAGEDIHLRDKNGATALHRAVRTRCAAAVKYLLARGSDATFKNNSGSTPFHLAVQNTGRGGSGAEASKAAQRQIIEEFLSSGLRPSLEDHNRKSVLDWAKSDWIRKMLSE